MEFAKQVSEYYKMVCKFGMRDQRYENSFNELSATFCVRTFRQVVGQVMEVIEKMKKDYYIEKSICLSNGPADLFKVLNTVFDSYKLCPSEDMLNSLLGLIFK